jgi:processive 1,2-diacylglycerol beta-glucosyltransferase
MRKVLILTAAYGEGHNAAARGLQAAFAELGTAEAVVVDPFVAALGRLYQRSRRDYLRLIETLPYLWSAVYQALHRTPLIHVLAAIQGPLRRELARLIDEHRPGAIISVYPLFPYLVNRLFPQPETRPFRLYTVVTDSITINSAWHRSPSDLYYVPNEESALVMGAAGVPAERLRVLGFPVPPVFARDRPTRPSPRDEPPRILFMINAGKRTAPALVRRLLQLDRIRLTITVGQDEALRAAIERIVRASGRQADVLGWIPNMPELLMTHHLLIGKAGGAAVQEAIAACTPMIITHVVPGQEEGNARLLLNHGCAALCETTGALADEIQALFAGGCPRWHAWEAAICRLSRPAAALEIAREIQGLID